MIKSKPVQARLREQIEFSNPQRWAGLDGDFRVNAFAVHERMPPVVIDRPAGTGDWLFMLFHDPVRVKCAGREEQIRPGGLMMWPCGAAHWYGDDCASWDHSWIHFTGQWAGQILEECRLAREAVVYLREPGLFTEWLFSLYGELSAHRHPDPVILRNLFQNGLRNLMRDVQEDAECFIPPKISQIRQYLDQHSRESVMLKDLAEKFAISVPHLSAEFRRCYGDSPINYMIRQRMRHARYLLLDRRLSVGEVAERVGYEDLFHFSRLFKKHFGVSPRGVRDGLLN